MDFRKLALSLCLATGAVACGGPDDRVAMNHPTTTSGSPSGQPSVLDQGESQADVSTTAEIRRALVADSSLSTSAQNVKIITRGGVTTLTGQVNSEAERSAVERAATATAGVTRVDNQLTVKTP
jgi:hyperosmotically inducible protein